MRAKGEVALGVILLLILESGLGEYLRYWCTSQGKGSGILPAPAMVLNYHSAVIQ